MSTSAHVSTAVREHYRDFYAGPPASDLPVLVVLGNCQAESLRLMLAGPDVCTVRVPALHELERDDLPHLRRLLAGTDLLVAQPTRADYRALPLGTDQVVDLLPAYAAHVLVPSVRFAGLHPHQLVVHPPGAGDPPVVPYHDVRTAVAASWARTGRSGPGSPPLTPAGLQAVVDDSLTELRTREVAAGAVAVSDLVLELLPREGFDLMRTVNHPGNGLLAAVAARLRHALGLAPLAPTVDRPLLAGIHAPREAAVVALVDPTATPCATWVVEGRIVEPEDVRAAHLEWYAAHPDALDEVLRRTRRTRAHLGLVAAAGEWG